jgi:hypothetical protein
MRQEPLTRCLFRATVGPGLVRKKNHLLINAHSREAQVYTITVSRPGPEQTVYSPVKEYETKDSMLTLAFDDNHDVVIPLFQVTAVDIVRQE